MAAPKQRNTEAEKAAVKDGKTAAEIWLDDPAKARPTADGKPQADIAIPSFGYKSNISICGTFGFIRKGKTTDGARYDGRMLRDVVTGDNTASDVWADTAYRSQSNERWLKAQGRVSRIHRRKPKGRPMPENVRRGNATKSKVRARVEHVFAHQKAKMGLFIRTIGIARAETKITLANLAFNMQRLIFHERLTTTG
ncbi:transposase [Acidiphilium sp. MT5]